MKKIIYLFVAFSCVCSVAFAQQEERKMRIVPEGYMPAEGDLSLGIGFAPGFGGNPILNNIYSQTPIEMNFLPQFSLLGKYQIGETTALRANIGFIGSSTNRKFYVQDDKAAMLNPLQVYPAAEKVVDVRNQKTNGASIAIGVEKQRAYRNVRGFAGASALYACGKQVNSYTYGNAITEVNLDPTTSGFMPQVNPAGYLSAARAMKIFNGNAHAVGLVGHVGVEWFFAPKVSLGGEMNISFLYQWNPQINATYEGWNPVSKQVEEYTQTMTPKSHGFYYGTDNLGSNFFLSFYF
ncbi:MAG: hypothetical protein FWC39_12765 [Bacteroidetes bacterium]|nr:hypothetical protein [Bacteroidota bacterium]